MNLTPSSILWFRSDAAVWGLSNGCGDDQLVIPNYLVFFKTNIESILLTSLQEIWRSKISKSLLGSTYYLNSNFTLGRNFNKMACLGWLPRKLILLKTSVSSLHTIYTLAASARSTRNAACQHAVSSHSGFAIQGIMWMHFSGIKETHLATLRPTGDPKQNRSGECIFPVHKSSSATSASEQLLELLLLKQLSEAAAFSARLF